MNMCMFARNVSLFILILFYKLQYRYVDMVLQYLVIAFMLQTKHTNSTSTIKKL